LVIRDGDSLSSLFLKHKNMKTYENVTCRDDFKAKESYLRERYHFLSESAMNSLIKNHAIKKPKPKKSDLEE